MWQQLLDQIRKADSKSLARAISLVENEADGYEDFLSRLTPGNNSTIIGITGPPGAGKSTITDAFIGEVVNDNKRIAVLCVDPSSPFHMGAVLGDRIRMSQWFTHASVFIRSLATRGSMGGLHPKIVEISELLKAAGYDYIVIETVGVGQSEVEIAALADITVVVVVPEAGDEVQTMKAGLMEIADIFVVNKSDRPGADTFVKNLQQMLAPTFTSHKQKVPIIKTVATRNSGIKELRKALDEYSAEQISPEKKTWLLADRAWKIIQEYRMKDISRESLAEQINKIPADEFNLYRFAKQFGVL